MPRLQALWTNIEGILGVAASDRDEWVRVVLALVLCLCFVCVVVLSSVVVYTSTHRLCGACS
jgi:hypothetical protein